MCDHRCQVYGVTNQIHRMKDLYKENTELKIQNTRLLKKCQTLWSNLANARQSIKEYKILLQDLENPIDRNAPLEEIAKAVSQASGVPISDMRSPNRERHNVIARQVFFYIGRRAGFSWLQLGQFMLRDHSTAIHGYRQIQDLISLPKSNFVEVQTYIHAREILAARDAERYQSI